MRYRVGMIARTAHSLPEPREWPAQEPITVTGMRQPEVNSLSTEVLRGDGRSLDMLLNCFDLKRGSATVICQAFGDDAPVFLGFFPRQPFVPGKAGIVVVLVKKHDGIGSAVIERITKRGRRRRIKIAIDVQQGNGARPIAKESRHALVIPSFDKVTVWISKLWRCRCEGSFWPRPPVLRKSLEGIEAVNLSIRAQFQELQEGVA